MSKLFSTQEAAEQLGMSGVWLRQQAAKNRVPHVRLGRCVRFTEEQIAEIIETNTRAVAAVQGGRGSARTRL